MLHQVGVLFDLYYDARKHKIKIQCESFEIYVETELWVFCLTTWIYFHFLWCYSPDLACVVSRMRSLVHTQLDKHTYTR